MTKWRYAYFSLDDPKFHWLLNATPDWRDTPWTHKKSGIEPHKYDAGGRGQSHGFHASSDPVSPYGSGSHPGVTRAHSGLLSRRGYIRIIREDTSVVERDLMVSELKLLAKKLLTGRSLTLFERRVIAPLEDPLTPKPSIADLAIEFNISEQRVYKIISKSWKKIEKAHRAAQAKEDAPIMLNTLTAKRQTGGINFQSEGRFVDASELPKAYSYSTSVNSAASAASTRDLKTDE
jgi:hypothetical protein